MYLSFQVLLNTSRNCLKNVAGKEKSTLTLHKQQIKVGVISQDFFQLCPILKKINQIHVPSSIFQHKWKREGIGSFFWGWDQIENTFWDYPTFKENLQLVFGAVQDYIISQRKKTNGMSPTEQSAEVRLDSFTSGGFTKTTVMNPLDEILENSTSVQGPSSLVLESLWVHQQNSF